MTAFRRHQVDPRPDQAEDSPLWVAVFTEAKGIEPWQESPLCGLLHGLRCGGARLRWTSAGTLHMDYSALVGTGLWDEQELRREWLMPAAEGIKAAFTAVERQQQGQKLRQSQLFGGVA